MLSSLHQSQQKDILNNKRFYYPKMLTVVNVASSFKATKPLTSNSSCEASRGFQILYKRGPLSWPNVLQGDPRREFMG